MSESKTDKKLRWAIIGCGNISRAHITAIEKIPEIELVAGCDIVPERLKEFTEKTGVKATYEKWDDMLAEIKPDVVDVCTPNGVHMPAVCAALNAGCHAITEKPMAMDPAECQQMIDCAKKNNKLLCAGFQVRYKPVCEFCNNARLNGDLGDILYVKVHASRRRGIPNWGVFGQKELQGGGPMIDIGVHMIESAHYCIGQPKPVAASANCWTYIGNKPSETRSIWPNWDWKTYNVEDLLVGQVRFENGIIMQIESAFACHNEKDNQNWSILGTKGGFDMATATLHRDHDGYMVDEKAAFLPEKNDFVSKLQNFVDAILKGTPLCCPGEEGLAVQKILDGCYRSAALGGKEVAID